MVQELKNINDIYLNLFYENKLNIMKFIENDFINTYNFDDYCVNLRIIKLLSEESSSILEINSFYNLPSISLLAGNPKKLIKISNNISFNYYELINYINDIELLIYEDFNKKLNSINFDFLYINNLNYDNNIYLYDKIFNNVKINKYIMIDGIDDYFLMKLKSLIERYNWKVYSINKTKFNFVILKRI